MKECGQLTEMTLTVNGYERTFQEQELIDILEKYSSNETTEQATVDKYFEVNPKAIDQTLFQKKRINRRQENTRKLILEAFAEVKSNPERYGKKFKTMTLNKMWPSKTGDEMKQLAYRLGDHNADWVEQALEWAQRICNGESWKSVCNNADTANWYRVVIWKNGYMKLIGGSCSSKNFYPASEVNDYDYYYYDRIYDAVPLVVIYDK